MRSAQTGRQHAAGHRLTSLLAVAVAISVVGSAGAAWDGRQDVRPGDSFSSAFELAPGQEVHRYSFYAPAGTVLDATMKVVSGSVVPRWTLSTELGAPVDMGAALNGDRLKKYTFDEGGRFVLDVTATAGTGRYVVATKARLPLKLKAKNAEGGFTFEALGGSLLAAKLRGATFTGLAGPTGAVDLGGEGLAKVKNVLLPADGEYTLTWDGTATLGGKLRAPGSVGWFFDSTADPRGLANLARDEWLGSGHADMTAEAFRHWDEDGSISTSCARCHSSLGFQDFLGADGTASAIDTPKGGTDNRAALGTTVDCDACHNSVTATLDRVTFPSGAVITGLGPEARCMQCHQGRESSVSLDEHIAAAAVADDDTESASLRFRNIHYFAAGASLYGNAAKGAYQFAGKIYNNKFPHVSTIDACQDCHNQHTLEIRYQVCATCHAGVASHDDLADIRHVGSLLDYDGDGNRTEGIHDELSGMAGKLYDAMRQYAGARGFQIVYDDHAYPYYFNDTNGDGVRTPDEGGYNHWTPRLLRAAYNYQYWKKDPGAFAHNGKYMIEILYDTLAHLNDHAAVTVLGFDAMVRNDGAHFDNTSYAFRRWDPNPVSSSCAKCHTPGGFEFAATYGIDPVTSYPSGDGFACEQCHLADDFDSPDPARRFVASVTFPSGVKITNDPANPDDSFLCMTCHQGRSSKKTIDDAIAAGGNLAFSNIHYLAAGPTLYGRDAGVGYEYAGKTYVGEFQHFGGGNTCAFCHLADHSFLPQLTASCTGCHMEAQGDLHKIRLNRATDYDGDGSATEPLKDEVSTFGARVLASIQDYARVNGKTHVVYGPNNPWWYKDNNQNGVLDPEETTSSNRYTGWDAPMLKAAFNYQMYKKEPGAWAHNTHYILALLYDSVEDVRLNSVTPLPTNHLTSPTPLTRP